jgi:hypothetical protein
MMLAGLSAWQAGVQQLAFVGRAGDASREALERVAASHYLPFAVIVPVEPGERQGRIAAVAPFVAVMSARNGAAAAYVCRDFACQAPVEDPEDLRSLISD